MTMSGADFILPFSFLLSIALKGSIVLLVAFCGLRLLRPKAAAHRHLVWALTLFALIALPALSASLPAWRAVPAVPAVERFVESFVGTAEQAVVAPRLAAEEGTVAERDGARLITVDKVSM